MLLLLFLLQLSTRGAPSSCVSAFTRQHATSALRRNRASQLQQEPRFNNHASYLASDTKNAARFYATQPTSTLDARLAQSCVQVTDPETGCQAVLVGCFHGANSSATDVLQALTDHPTQALVLELCYERFLQFRVDWAKRQEEALQQADGTNDDKPSTTSSSEPWILGYANMVQQTVQMQGLGAGVAAAILAGISGFQTALSGLESGLEFTTALDAAGASLTVDNDKMIIYLADQTIEDTLNKLGRLPLLSLRMWKDWAVDKQFAWQHSHFCREAATLQTALLGNSSMPSNSQLSLLSFVSRNGAAVRDVARFTLAWTILLLLPTIMDSNMNWQDSSVAVPAGNGLLESPFLASAGFSLPTLQDFLLVAVADAVGFFLGYLTVTLPVTAVILRERDDQLVDGIREACRLAAKNHGPAKESSSEQGGPRVVAVLGFLHVNGVAQRLLETND